MRYEDVQKGQQVQRGGRVGSVVFGLPVIASVAVVWDDSRTAQPDIVKVRDLSPVGEEAAS